MLMVTAYGLHYVVKWTKPLHQVQGMSYGVREDAISGVRRGLVSNQCISDLSAGVYYWNIFDREVERKRLEKAVAKAPVCEHDEALKRLDEFNHTCYPADDTEEVQA